MSLQQWVVAIRQERQRRADRRQAARVHSIGRRVTAVWWEELGSRDSGNCASNPRRVDQDWRDAPPSSCRCSMNVRRRSMPSRWLRWEKPYYPLLRMAHEAVTVYRLGRWRGCSIHFQNW